MISDLEIRKFEKAYKKEFEKWLLIKEAGEHEMVSLAETIQFGKTAGNARSICNGTCGHGIQ